MNRKNLAYWFVVSAGCILLITGAAKIWSSFGHAKLLQYYDPILRVGINRLLALVGSLEIIVAAFCLAAPRKQMSVLMIAALANSFLTYRVGLWWVHWAPCSCLGTVTDNLGISEPVANRIMKMILCYLLVGSYSIIFRTYSGRKKTVGGGAVAAVGQAGN